MGVEADVGWLKIDDQFEQHEKVEQLSDAAHRLWMKAACWCRQAKNAVTNGFIPARVVIDLCKGSQQRATALASELVEARGEPCFGHEHGLWEPSEGGWQFHDWADYQPNDEADAARRDEIRRVRSEAGRSGGLASAEARAARFGSAQPKRPEANPEAPPEANQDPAEERPEANPEARPEADSEAKPAEKSASPKANPEAKGTNQEADNPAKASKQTKQTPSPLPLPPPLPDPDPDPEDPPCSPPKGETQPNRGPARKSPKGRLPDGWAPNEGHRSLASELGVDLATEVPKFIDHAAATDRRMVDWDATFRTWLRNAREFRRGGLLPSAPRDCRADAQMRRQIAHIQELEERERSAR